MIFPSFLSQSRSASFSPSPVLMFFSTQAARNLRYVSSSMSRIVVDMVAMLSDYKLITRFIKDMCYKC